MPDVLLYGIVPSDLPWSDGVDGVRGEPVRRVDHDGLAALVSDVEGELLGRRRELVAHTAVLEAALERGPVLPARFGTVAPDDDAVVRDLLAPRHDRLVALLDDVEGLVEVRISATYDEEAVLAEIVGREPQLQTAAGGGMGDRMAVGRRVVEAIDAQRRSDAAALLDRLAPLAQDVRDQPVRSELGVVDLALLVAREDLDEVDRAVAEASAPLTARARVRYVGPLPPATFFALEG